MSTKSAARAGARLSRRRPCSVSRDADVRRLHPGMVGLRAAPPRAGHRRWREGQPRGAKDNPTGGAVVPSQGEVRGAYRAGRGCRCSSSGWASPQTHGHRHKPTGGASPQTHRGCGRPEGEVGIKDNPTRGAVVPSQTHRGCGWASPHAVGHRHTHRGCGRPEGGGPRRVTRGSAMPKRILAAAEAVIAPPSPRSRRPRCSHSGLGHDDASDGRTDASPRRHAGSQVAR